MSPDGRWIISASQDDTIRIWDAATGTERALLTAPGEATAVAFHPCAPMVLCGDAGGGGISPISSASSSGPFVVTASLHGHLLTVRCPACRQAFPIDRDHLGAETACPRPACGRSLRINPFLPFDISDAAGAERATLSGHTGQVLGCAVSPDGTWIVSASADRTLKIWDVATGVERAILAGHTDSVLRLCSESGRRLDRLRQQRQDPQDLGCRHRRPTGHPRRTHRPGVRLCCEPRRRLDRLGRLRQHPQDLGRRHRRRTGSPCRGHVARCRDCAVSPDGTWIVSASMDQTLKIWDAATRKKRAVLLGHTDSVIACAVSPDGGWIVSASGGRSRARPLTKEGGGPGHLLIGGPATLPPPGQDHTLKIWDAATGTERATLSGHTDLVYGCAVSPDGAWIVSASWDRTLRVWDVATGAQRGSLIGHTDPVVACAVSPDGAWIVSASWDRTLKIWDPALPQPRHSARPRRWRPAAT